MMEGVSPRFLRPRRFRSLMQMDARRTSAGLAGQGRPAAGAKPARARRSQRPNRWTYPALVDLLNADHNLLAPPDAELPPAGRPVDPAALAEAAAGYGIEILGPIGALPPGPSELPEREMPPAAANCSTPGSPTRFTHLSEGRARAEDLDTSICAVLLAEACNISLTEVAQPTGVPALSYNRLSWVSQNYVRPETIAAANELTPIAKAKKTSSARSASRSTRSWFGTLNTWTTPSPTFEPASGRSPTKTSTPLAAAARAHQDARQLPLHPAPQARGWATTPATRT